MKTEIPILIVEDDLGHATLIRKNLKRAGIGNTIMHFNDGQEVLDFLLGDPAGADNSFLMLLDINMPRVDGIEVLKRVKAHPKLRKMPIIMVTTSENPEEIERCHDAGCSVYVTKPVEYEQFVNAIRQLGLFLAIVQVPEKIRGKN
ncbi:MAG: response regulator [bacterium]|nr:response regulator [bacterium]